MGIFFIINSNIKINLLISDTQVGLSCHPKINITVNFNSFLCNRTSVMNPKFDMITSIMISGKEYLKSHINSYTFLASALYLDEIEEEHILAPTLIKEKPFAFVTTPIKKLGKVLNVHHSILMRIFTYSLLVVLCMLIAGLLFIVFYCVWRFTQVQIICWRGIHSLFACCKKNERVEQEDDQELGLIRSNETAGATAPLSTEPPAYPGSNQSVSTNDSCIDAKSFPPLPTNLDDLGTRMYNLLG